ncbi:hypothetical protein GUJ93_ZPchr0013g34560 [Zizania palustris]|uniref:Uncharacterized protein n=1 Tax=Zizania palustris TaxID=103762 RepID=A0A8J5WVN8_ZIZPA|nr:hypothetical protein GUJ93_ZPchr0013g34560 [Zizania palustris]
MSSPDLGAFTHVSNNLVLCVRVFTLKSSSPTWRLVHAASSAGVAAEGMVKPMVVASRAEGSATWLASKAEDQFFRRSFVAQSTEKPRKALAFIARGRAFVARTVRQSASHYAWLHRNKLCSNHCGDKEEASAEGGFGVYGVPWPQVVVGEAVGFSSSLEAVTAAMVSMAMESSS